MPNDEFEYIDESQTRKKVNKKPLIIIAVVLGALVFIAIVAGVVMLLTKDHKKSGKEDTSNIVDEGNKYYDRVSGLIIPKEYSKEIYNKYDDIIIEVETITANKSGYALDLVVKKNNPNTANVIIDCSKVLIDGFETSVSFKATAKFGDMYKETITIPKTELDLLEITEFNEIRFLASLWKENQEKNKEYITMLLTTRGKLPVDNSKERVVYDNVGNVSLSIYKMEEDNDYNYIFFDFLNNSNNENFDIYINKLKVNGDVYIYNDFHETSHYKGEKIFFLEIPKKDYKTIEKIDISFFFIKNEGENNQVIKTSNLKEFFVDKLHK